MKAYVFPGQGAQFVGMAKTLLEVDPKAQEWLDKADQIVGFNLSKIMTDGTEEELVQTRVTQPAIFVHSVVRALLAGDDFKPEAVAGHSLGEFSALAAVGAISFEDGLKLVAQRAEAMQQAGEQTPGTMAAIVGLDDEVVEKICADTSGVVVAANYNCPGQLVISGEIEAVQAAMEKCTAAGARRALQLKVGGAFHSPLMEPARKALEEAIANTEIKKPIAKVYQNVDAQPHDDVDTIRKNLIAQLTSPVKWTKSVQQMLADGVSHFTEVGGKGSVIRGLIRKIDRGAASDALA